MNAGECGRIDSIKASYVVNIIGDARIDDINPLYTSGLSFIKKIFRD